MFEPSFEKNREEFKRLHRYQVLAVIAGVLCGFLLLLVVASLHAGNSPWVPWAALSLVVIGGIVIGALEVKKTLVFRRDLLEQRLASKRDSSANG
jgi:hypothetical protein